MRARGQVLSITVKFCPAHGRDLRGNMFLASVGVLVVVVIRVQSEICVVGSRDLRQSLSFSSSPSADSILNVSKI